MLLREPFMNRWVAMLRQTMATTGKGYMRHSLRNTGRRVWEDGKPTDKFDCRGDKEFKAGRRLTKAFRTYKARYGR